MADDQDDGTGQGGFGVVRSGCQRIGGMGGGFLATRVPS
jgi:hypothetical protein